MDERDRLAERYYDLMTLQRRVNVALDEQAAYVSEEASRADEALMREIDKLVRLDGDPEVFRAIARAALETAEGDSFTRLAEETAVRARLQALTRRHGAPVAFRKALTDSREALEQKEQRVEELQTSIARLETQLESVTAYNHGKSLKISSQNRKKIEEVGFFDRIGDAQLAEVSSVCSRYAKKHGVRRGDYFTPANCFDDMERLRAEKQELEALGPSIEYHKDKYYQECADYKDIRDIQAALKQKGVADNAPVDLPGFQQELARRLTDGNFLSGFARNTASGVGGALVLAALIAGTSRRIAQNLTGYQAHVKETTRMLEGPIGSIARALRRDDALDYIARDIKWQAGMAGYLGVSAAAALRGLLSFRPDHTEGPVSVNRDIQMHLAVNGKVDPAYIQEVCGMDRLLTQYFNLNAFRPRPDFKTVLANPVAVERIDRHYADFLRGMAEDEEFTAAGFAAGQFDHISFDKLLGRYFSASATREQMADALREEAARIEAEGDKREALGIDRGGPRLPEI